MCRLVGAFAVHDVLPGKCSNSMCYVLVLAPMAETLESLFALLTVEGERSDNAGSTFNGMVGAGSSGCQWLLTVGRGRMN